jgi:hypothetical protein
MADTWFDTVLHPTERCILEALQRTAGQSSALACATTRYLHSVDDKCQLHVQLQEHVGSYQDAPTVYMKLAFTTNKANTT